MPRQTAVSALSQNHICEAKVGRRGEIALVAFCTLWALCVLTTGGRPVMKYLPVHVPLHTAIMNYLPS